LHIGASTTAGTVPICRRTVVPLYFLAGTPVSGFFDVTPTQKAAFTIAWDEKGYAKDLIDRQRKSRIGVRWYLQGGLHTS